MGWGVFYGGMLMFGTDAFGDYWPVPNSFRAGGAETHSYRSVVRPRDFLVNSRCSIHIKRE